MENLNLVELLRDCPTGMELDCYVFYNVTFDYVNTQQNRVYCKVNKSESVWFTPKGGVNLLPDAKCVIFPKGKTSWKGFHRPFNDGDVAITTMGNIAIIKEPSVNGYFSHVCMLPDKSLIPGLNCGFSRLATEEEKQELFDTIKVKGYRWNSETKTLEKLPQKSKISWHTGIPENLGFYLVTLSDGRVSADIYLESTQHWDRYSADKIVAWCPVDEIEPYNHN